MRWLSEDMGLSVDAHSQENFGYNYTDVAYLIDSLGATPNQVIGGYFLRLQSEAGIQTGKILLMKVGALHGQGSGKFHLGRRHLQLSD